MQPWEPGADPRLVEFDDAEEDDVVDEATLARIVEMQQQAVLLGNAQTFFTSDVWAFIAGLSERDRRNLDVRLAKEEDQATWKYLRGQMVVHDWLQALPELVMKKRRQVDRALRALQGEALAEQEDGAE